MKLLIATFLLFSINAFAADGVLIIAHGTMVHRAGGGHHHGNCNSHSTWENNVSDAVGKAAKQTTRAVEVAFGMWETSCYEEGIKALQARVGNLTDLYVIPLFISSNSEVIEAQKYIFKVTSAPPALFTDYGITLTQTSFSGNIHYLSAIDYHARISEILKARAQELLKLAGTTDATKTQLHVVLHGPISEADNQLWLALGHRYASDLTALGFHHITVHSVRDDSEAQVKATATRELRFAVEDGQKNNRQALVLPLLLSTGGIEQGILDRLQGLQYVWSGNALLPDSLFEKYLADRLQAIR